MALWWSVLCGVLLDSTQKERGRPPYSVVADFVTTILAAFDHPVLLLLAPVRPGES